MILNKNNLRTAVSCILLAVGLLISIFQALPYFQDKHHINIVSYRGYSGEMTNLTSIYFKMETSDVFVANNPINISISTGVTDEVRGILLTFDGAESCFLGDLYEATQPIYSQPLSSEKIKKLSDEIETFNKKCSNNKILLQKISLLTGSNISYFSGNLQLTYPEGGNFDIGISFDRGRGNEGYEFGNRQSAIKGAIPILSPDILYSINNSNIMTGLAWLGIGLTLILPGLINLTSKDDN